MKTKKLYYLDSHIKNFIGTIISCTKNTNGDFLLELDQTAFYPEGGGQPADKGIIGTANVLDVLDKDGTVLHVVDKELVVGDVINCSIDWDYRFMLMAHHSGEHIVSGLIHKYFNYDNVGFHMGTDAVTMDFNGNLSKEDLIMIEQKANNIIYSNLPIKISYPTNEDLKTLEYRSKKDLTNDVRIVTIKDCDICACCAVHMHTTGEIGLIKLISCIKYKSGIRISLLCGKKALIDYENKSTELENISVLLSAKQNEAFKSVQKLKDDYNLLKDEMVKMRHNLFDYKASFYNSKENICILEDNLSMNELRYFCNLLLKQCSGICAVFSNTNDNEYYYIIGSNTKDVRPLLGILKEKFQTKGGGVKEMVQGSIHGEFLEIKKTFGFNDL